MVDLEHLHPYVHQKALELIERANKKLKDYTVIITQGYRSIEEQNRIYEQGRSLPGKIVSNAKGGHSLHNYGLAIDFALKNKSTGAVIWNEKLTEWNTVVAIAKALGFEWGGDWTSFKDYPHFQMTGGLTNAEIFAGKVPVFEQPKPVERKLEILKPINLWKRSGDDLKMVRVLKPGEVFRVYGYDNLHGGQYNVGGLWVTNMKDYVKEL